MSKLLPFERSILSSVRALLSPQLQEQLRLQVEHINKVQRLLQWNEIEFYCMRWFKVRWPSEVLFENRSEFVLGSGTISAGESAAEVNVWSVGGHVFSIESKSSLKVFRTSENCSFIPAEKAVQLAVPRDVVVPSV